MEGRCSFHEGERCFSVRMNNGGSCPSFSRRTHETVAPQKPKASLANAITRALSFL
ncbi:hypothetical protein HY227_01950 [Candidatus Wolfebacteria bacterium]|nr:hypothetical protein [Candidatus Wolfebacteria bacterium]